jgi:glycosyltransferase involved in cell wall biosynthesis
MKALPFPPVLRRARQPLRVLQVVGNGIVGGMERCVERLVERLPPDQFETQFLCPFESHFTDRLRARGHLVSITPMPEDPPWCSIQMACSIVNSGGVDVLHAHLPNAHVLAALAGHLTGRPVLTTIHGRQLTTLDLEVHRAAGSYLSVVCRQSYHHALGLGVRRDHLSLDPNGVDTAVFQPRVATDRPGVLRRALGLDLQTPLLGFVGRLSWEKGPDVFVRAALLLQGNCPQAHAVLVGEGPMEPALRTLIADLGLQHRVHLLGLRSDMPQVYQDLDVLLCSSYTEAMPLSVMEAMASGLAVVAPHVGGVPELVAHGQTGWLVRPGDFEDMARRCGALLQDTLARECMGAAARERAVTHLDLNDSVVRTAQLLTRLTHLKSTALAVMPRPVRVGALGDKKEARPQPGGMNSLDAQGGAGLPV